LTRYWLSNISGKVDYADVDFPAQQSRQLDFQTRAEPEEIIRRVPRLESHRDIDVAQRPEAAGICRAEQIGQINVLTLKQRRAGFGKKFFDVCAFHIFPMKISASYDIKKSDYG
jgi:hypothetical protein